MPDSVLVSDAVAGLIDSHFLKSVTDTRGVILEANDLFCRLSEYPRAELIGKPQLNFSLMVWGQPGQGKSTFSIAFGNYLAQHFGKVAYLSSEEYGSYTLQDKLKRVGQISPKLFFIKNLQEFKPTYDFLLIDSVNNFGLGLEEYRALRAKYPNIGIVLIMQATKGGQFRGEKAWEHDVDTVIKLEAGKAFTTKNRFKELSQITVF